MKEESREERIEKLVLTWTELHKFQNIEVNEEHVRKEAEKTIEWHERGSNPNEVVNPQKHYLY